MIKWSHKVAYSIQYSKEMSRGGNIQGGAHLPNQNFVSESLNVKFKIKIMAIKTQSQQGLALECCLCRGRLQEAVPLVRSCSRCCTQRRSPCGDVCRSAPCRGQCQRRSPPWSWHAGGRSGSARWPTGCLQGTRWRPLRLPSQVSIKHRYGWSRSASQHLVQ